MHLVKQMIKTTWKECYKYSMQVTKCFKSTKQDTNTKPQIWILGTLNNRQNAILRLEQVRTQNQG
jgi:hypothetical protein